MTLETFSNRFYKDLDDAVLVGDMSDNDVIVCFELPCHAQQSRTWKPDPDPSKNPLILPVHMSRELPGSRAPFRSSSSSFAHPFIVVLSPEQVQDKEQIYAAVVDRLQRWTSNAKDLFQWQHEVTAEISMDSPPVSSSVTEFKENGDIVTVQEGDGPEEGDIADAKSILEEEGDSDELSVSTVKRLGPKADLFRMNIHTGHERFGTGAHWSSTSRWVSWEGRALNASRDEHPALLEEGDALICEWDDNLRVYYFGDGRNDDTARWVESHWGDFIHPEYEEAQAQSRSRKIKGITLQDCLEEFTKEERLGEDDLWYCPRCKKHQQATKKFDLWTVPDVLVVHLKRFSNSRILRDKIDAFVDFPIEGLNLESFCGEREVAQRLSQQGQEASDLVLSDLDEPLLYDLYAVDEHLGGLGGGHYRAYAKNHQTGQWYHFDDSYVTKSKASEAVVSYT